MPLGIALHSYSLQQGLCLVSLSVVIQWQLQWFGIMQYRNVSRKYKKKLQSKVLYTLCRNWYWLNSLEVWQCHLCKQLCPKISMVWTKTFTFHFMLHTIINSKLLQTWLTNLLVKHKLWLCFLHHRLRYYWLVARGKPESGHWLSQVYKVSEESRYVSS